MTNLSELNKFLQECIDKGVEVPTSLEVVVEDYPNVVSDDYKYRSEVEYNYRSEKYESKNNATRMTIVNWCAIKRGDVRS